MKYLMLVILFSACTKEVLPPTLQIKPQKELLSLVVKSCDKYSLEIKKGVLDPSNKKRGSFGGCLSEETHIKCGSVDIMTINKQFCVYGIGIVECGCRSEMSLRIDNNIIEKSGIDYRNFLRAVAKKREMMKEKEKTKLIKSLKEKLK